MGKLTKEYGNKGWLSSSTGGGCNAFSLELTNLRKDLSEFLKDMNEWQVGLSEHATTEEILLHIQASYEHLTRQKPYLLCTDIDGLQEPTRLTQPIMLGLYDEEGQYIGLGEDRRSVLEEWKAKKLTTKVLFEDYDNIIEYFRTQLQREQARRSQEARKKKGGSDGNKR